MDFTEKWFQLTSQQKFDFIERSVLIHDSKGNTFPLKLAPFQKEWLEKGPLFTDFRKLTTFTNRITLKCRNVGASYVMIALESVLTGYIYPKITIPFIAPTEDQTKVLIESCISLIQDIKFDVGLVGGIKNQTKTEIKFANGSKIKAFSSNPKGMRGTRALCFAYSTPILTDLGYVAIGDVVTKGIGSEVLSYNHNLGKSEWKPITNRFKNPLGSKDLITLNGITCTSDHKFFNGEDYVEANSLDKVYKLSDTYDIHESKIYEKQIISKKEEYVYDIEVGDNHNFFAGGYLVHNCVYLDEMAHLEHDQEIMDAVSYFLVEGGQLNILSTPWGKQNLYWRIWSDVESYPEWFRLDIKPFSGEIDINQSIKQQISDGHIKPLIPWLNVDKVEGDRKADSHNGYRNFMQEMLGIPLEEVSSVISTELLNTVTKDNFTLVRRTSDSQVFGVGVDYGASNNMTAAVTAIFENGRLVVCNTTQFSGNVDIQIDSIEAYVKKFKHDYYFGDATGLGGHSFQDVLGARNVPVGMIIGVDYSKKDIASRFGSNMNNKEFMINRTLELMARGKIIVPHNFRELRLQILGVKKYVYDKHVKYSGKDSLTKNDDLAMAFFQLVLAYDYHYGIGDLEAVSSGKTDWFNRDSKPKARKAQYFEGTSVRGVQTPSSRGGFGKFG